MLLVHFSCPLFWKHIYEDANGRRKYGGTQSFVNHKGILVCRSALCNSYGRTLCRKAW